LKTRSRADMSSSGAAAAAAAAAAKASALLVEAEADAFEAVPLVTAVLLALDDDPPLLPELEPEEADVLAGAGRVGGLSVIPFTGSVTATTGPRTESEKPTRSTPEPLQMRMSIGPES